MVSLNTPFLLFLPATTSPLPHYAIIDHVFSKSCYAFRTELMTHFRPQLKPGQINDYDDPLVTLLGTPTNQQTIRGDHTCFIYQSFSMNKYPYLYHFRTSLKSECQRLFDSFIEMTKWSLQFAIYPPIAQYLRHLDSHENENDRIITVMYYLNDDDWNASQNGGCLRICQGDKSMEDIVPFFDRMIVFRSRIIEHELLLCKKEKIALTVWVYGKHDSKRPAVLNIVLKQPEEGTEQH